MKNKMPYLKIKPDFFLPLLVICLVMLFGVLRSEAQINAPISLNIVNPVDGNQGKEKNYLLVEGNNYLLNRTHSTGYQQVGGEIIDDLFDRVLQLEQFISNMNPSKEKIVFAEGLQNNTTTLDAWRCKISKISTGVYEVSFANAHPQGSNYGVKFGQEESGTNRDVPKVSVIDGTKTANGFRVQVTVDDNGTGADILSDDIWSFELNEIKIIYVQE